MRTFALALSHGVLTFDRAQVASIDRSKGSPLREYQERLSKIDPSKAPAAWERPAALASAAPPKP